MHVKKQLESVKSTMILLSHLFFLQMLGSTRGGSGGGHGGSGGRGSDLTKVGQGYDSIYEPNQYGSHGGYGQQYGKKSFISHVYIK